MNFKVIKPSWEYRADGALALKDAGVVLLEFAPAQKGSGTSPGERRYDWENKTVKSYSCMLHFVLSTGQQLQIMHCKLHKLTNVAAEYCLEPS